MSSGEGAEEAAKDAADIATFFKSGKRSSRGSVRLWDIVCALAPVGWMGGEARSPLTFAVDFVQYNALSAKITTMLV